MFSSPFLPYSNPVDHAQCLHIAATTSWWCELQSPVLMLLRGNGLGQSAGSCCSEFISYLRFRRNTSLQSLSPFVRLPRALFPFLFSGNISCVHMCVFTEPIPQIHQEQWIVARINKVSSPSCVPLQNEVSALFIPSCRKFPHGDRSMLHIASWL